MLTVGSMASCGLALTDTTVTIDILNGHQKHNLEWLYHKNNDGLASEVDAVWIDNVSLNATSSLVEDADDDNDGLLDTTIIRSLIASSGQYRLGWLR